MDITDVLAILKALSNSQEFLLACKENLITSGSDFEKTYQNELFFWCYF